MPGPENVHFRKIAFFYLNAFRFPFIEAQVQSTYSFCLTFLLNTLEHKAL